MSLNQIQLTNQLLTELYADVLVEANTLSGEAPKVKTQADSTTTSLKYLGNNEKNIVLLVNNPDIPFLTDEQLGFLTSILTACKLSLADIALVNLYSVAEEQIHTSLLSLHPKSMILFGIPPLSIQLPINFPQFQVQYFNNCTYLSSPDLQELIKDKAQKLKLWNSLKTLFGL